MTPTKELVQIFLSSPLFGTLPPYHGYPIISLSEIQQFFLAFVLAFFGLESGFLRPSKWKFHILVVLLPPNLGSGLRCGLG